jgi:hypothetical protein
VREEKGQQRAQTRNEFFVGYDSNYYSLLACASLSSAQAYIMQPLLVFPSSSFDIYDMALGITLHTSTEG